MTDLDEAYREYAHIVYGYLRSLCRDDDLAEELTQETFYQAVRSAPRFDGSCRVSTWLCQIAKHLWYRELTRRRRKGTLPLEEEQLPPTPSTEEDVLRREDALRLYRRSHALSVRAREGGYELVFDSVDEGYRMNVGYTESEPVDGGEPVFTLCVVKYRRNPFDPHERRLQCINAYPYAFSGTNCFTVGYQNSWFDQSQLYYDEDDLIAIEFADCVRTIRLTDLRAGDLSSLH